MPKPLFTDEQKAEIARRYQAGETQAQIAADYSCFPSTIEKQLKKLGIPARPKDTMLRDRRLECPFSVATMEHLYWTLALSLHQIAERAQEAAGWDKCPSDSAVRRWYTAAGVRMRSRSEANALNIERHRRDGTGPFAAESKKAVIDAVARRWQPAIIAGKVVRPVNSGHKWTAAQRQKLRSRDCTCGQTPHKSRCPVYQREWQARKRRERKQTK